MIKKNLSRLLVMIVLLVLLIVCTLVVAPTSGFTPGGASAQITERVETIEGRQVMVKEVKETLSEIDEVWFLIDSLIGSKYEGKIWDPEKGWRELEVTVTRTPIAAPVSPISSTGLSPRRDEGPDQYTPRALLNFGTQFVGLPYVWAGNSPPIESHLWTSCALCVKAACQETCKISQSRCGGCINKQRKNCESQGMCSADADCRTACTKARKPDQVDGPCAQYIDPDNIQPGQISRFSCPYCPENNCNKGGFDCQGLVMYVVRTQWGSKYYMGGGVGGQYKRCQKNSWCELIPLLPDSATLPSYDYDFSKIKPGDVFYIGTRDGLGGCIEVDSRDDPQKMSHTGFIYSIERDEIRTLEASGGVGIYKLNTEYRSDKKNVCGIARLTYLGENPPSPSTQTSTTGN